jgi:hypothetical protein
MAIGFQNGGLTTFTNNTVVTYAPVTLDLSCSGGTGSTLVQGQGTCPNSTFTVTGNIFLGYDNPATYGEGGQPGGPGMYYYGQPIGHTVRSNNTYFGMRSFSPLAGEQVANPLFVGQPTGAGSTFTEQELDNFNFMLTSGSPATGQGATP